MTIRKTQRPDQRDGNKLPLRSTSYCGKASFLRVCSPVCRGLRGNYSRPTHQACVCSMFQCDHIFSWKPGKWRSSKRSYYNSENFEAIYRIPVLYLLSLQLPLNDDNVRRLPYFGCIDAKRCPSNGVCRTHDPHTCHLCRVCSPHTRDASLVLMVTMGKSAFLYL